MGGSTVPRRATLTRRAPRRGAAPPGAGTPKWGRLTQHHLRHQRKDTGPVMSMLEASPDTTLATASCDARPTHAVHLCQVDATPRLAYCGADCSGEGEGFSATPCYVCLDLIRYPCGRCDS